MRGVNRYDVMVAVGFMVAGATEAAIRYHATPGLLAFNMSGALWLGSLAVRRQRPLVPICVIAGAGVVGAALTAVLWPDSGDGGGVWILALLLASYSVGAHQRGGVVVLGALLPMVVVVAADLHARSGWSRISGILFVSVFVGLLPTAVGRVVRIRRERLQILRDQHERIEKALRSRQASAVLAERLRTAERLQATLVEGLQQLAATAESAAGQDSQPGDIEVMARSLLTRTREEVVLLAAPVEDSPPVELSSRDHVRALRAASQPWTVMAAGAVVAGLSVETAQLLEPAAPGWLVLPAAVLVGAPLAFAWWRPVTTVALAWIAMSAYSRFLTPLDGTLSETAFALGVAFAVAALSHRRAAIAGLAVCWLGQLLGVGADGALGEAGLLLLCWLGGLAVNDVSRLMEQTRANTELLSRSEAEAAANAVVEERLRLAREIHDAIGHSLTVVALQAGAARRLVSTDPKRAQDIMRTVATVARSGIASLHLDDSSADLVGLVQRVRATGLMVDAELADEALLDPTERIVAFRVVQEGLTNVLKHAPGACVTVAVRRVAGGVEIVVANSASAVPGSGPGTGRGLAGIQERVEAHAGQATWRALGHGGFELCALLPMSPAAVSVR